MFDKVIEASDTWSLAVALFEKVVEPSGGGAS